MQPTRPPQPVTNVPPVTQPRPQPPPPQPQPTSPPSQQYRNPGCGIRNVGGLDFSINDIEVIYF